MEFEVIADLTETRKDGWKMTERTSEFYSSLEEAFFQAAMLAYPDYSGLPESEIHSDGSYVYIYNNDNKPEQLAFFRYFIATTRRLMRRIVAPKLIKRCVPYLKKHEIVPDSVFNMRKQGFYVCATPPGYPTTHGRLANRGKAIKCHCARWFETLTTLERRLADVICLRDGLSPHSKVYKKSEGGLALRNLLIEDRIAPERINNVLDFLARNTDKRIPKIRSSQALRNHFTELEWLMEEREYGEEKKKYIENVEQSEEQSYRYSVIGHK